MPKQLLKAVGAQTQAECAHFRIIRFFASQDNK